MNNAVNLVILAGGKGTRIKKHLGNFPKPMVKFNKKNFLIDCLRYFENFFEIDDY